MSEVLGLVQIGRISDISLIDLSSFLSKKLSIAVQLKSPLLNPSEAYDSRRNQYHSTRMLVLLEHHLASVKADRILGIAASDLFVPGMNFVFGEARCPGQAAVVSSFRLHQADELGEEEQFEPRIRKEAVHEIGHMLGLQHCSNVNCVMHFSKTLIDTDIKNDNYCSECQTQIETVTFG
jgi:archaemetzincin